MHPGLTAGRGRFIMIMKIMSKQETGKREVVLQAIAGRVDHPTAEELYLELRAQGKEISLATVYRALRSLSEEALISAIPLAPADRFDPHTSPHYHFHCRACGRLVDLETPYRLELDQAIAGQGFVVHHHTLVFHGLCPACRKRRDHGESSKRDGGTDRS